MGLDVDKLNILERMLEEEVLRKYSVRMLVDAMRQLSGEYRTTVWMKYFEQYTDDEVSRVL